MNDKPMLVFEVSVMLMNGQAMEQDVAASNAFAAVDFIKAEAAKNGWGIAALLVEMKSFDGKTIDMLEN